MNNPGSSSSKRVHDRTERLNKSCFCVTLDLPSLREAMERIVTLSVPLVAEVSSGNSWYEAK